jgi:hypothetical protein
MGNKERWQIGRRGASCAASCMRAWASPQIAVSLFSALLILANAAVPYWHAAQKAQAWASAIAAPPAMRHAAMAAGVDCPLHNAGTGRQKDGDKAPASKKPCPLCQALQFFSPGVTRPGFAFLPCAPLAVAAFVPHRVELKTGQDIAEQGRPRAPPLA